MTIRTVLLITLGSFLAGLAVCLLHDRLPSEQAEAVAFFFAEAGLGEYLRPWPVPGDGRA